MGGRIFQPDAKGAWIIDMDSKIKKEKVLPVAELPIEEKKEEPQEEAPKKVSIMDMVKEV